MKTILKSLTVQSVCGFLMLGFAVLNFCVGNVWMGVGCQVAGTAMLFTD